jgi:hypothetical protein
MSERVRSVAGSAVCTAPAETVWAVWTTPDEWRGDVIEVGTVDGDFAPGSRVGVKVRGGVKTSSRLTTVERPAVWTSVTRFPGLTLTYDHTIDAGADGTVLTERVTMSGLLAPLTHRLLRRNLEDTFTSVTAYIAHLAETRLPR